jgi:hypothetical protein
MSTGTIVAIIVAVVVVIAVIAFALSKTRRSKSLKTKFGPEYDHAVSTAGDARRAEEVLERRKERVEKYHLRALRPEEIDRFSRNWKDVQAKFVDDPKGAVADADRLVSDAMTARGYPIPDIQTRIEDLSVEHPHEVTHYRAAHEIAQRAAGGNASTEDLRQAMQHYRSIFEILLDRRVSATEVHEEVRR